MKRKTKKKPSLQECVNSVSPSPWAKFKSKETSYQGGFNAGYDQALKDKHERLNEREKEVHRKEFDIRVKALSNICQAGSDVVVSMSKAFLAYEKVL